MHRHVSDRFVQRAQTEGYRSRAAYKLKELAQRDRLIRPGMRVVDLGAAPGGWSQVASELVGTQGLVIAVDILEMKPIAGVVFVRGDFREESTLQAVEAALDGGRVDLVLSDMAPNLSGVAVVDQARTMQLTELALTFALKWLKPRGNLLVKSFQGAAFGGMREQVRRHFREVAVRKPPASRSSSSEIYLLGRDLIVQGGA